jgi:hypothetical protein
MPDASFFNKRRPEGAVKRSQGTSSVLRGDDLKSEPSSLPTEPVLGASEGVLFSLVKDALVVGLPCAQQMEHYPCKLVGRG